MQPGHSVTGSTSEQGPMTWSERQGWAALCGCWAPGPPATTGGGHSPHIEGGHQPHHVLPVFGQLELGDLGRVKVGRVVFLWGGRKRQGSCLQTQGWPRAEGRGPGGCVGSPRPPPGSRSETPAMLSASTRYSRRTEKNPQREKARGAKPRGNQVRASRIFSNGGTQDGELGSPGRQVRQRV